MARAKPQTTKYPGVFKRVTTHGTKYDIALRANGTQRWIRGKYTNLEAAQKHRLQLLYHAKHGTLPDSEPPSFGDFADGWLASQEARVAQSGLRSSTVRQRKHDLEKHIRPVFDNTRVDRIGVEQIQRLQNELSRAGRSNHTVRRVIVTLGAILEEARRHRHIAINPAADVRKPPAVRRREPLALTHEDVARLAAAAPTADEANLVLVAAYAGLRQAELFGLRWDNVVLSEGEETLFVAEQYYEGEFVSRPKTRSGRRAVPLAAPEAADALRDQRERGRWGREQLVFPAPEGGPWRASNFTRRQWRKMRDDAKLPELKFHDLRHFFVSYIRSLDLPPSITLQLVGHADERTHDLYTRPAPGVEGYLRRVMTAAAAERENA